MQWCRQKAIRSDCFFFWLNSPELALQRVSERVSKGGHNIPEPIVRRRYVAGISNLFRLFMNEVDLWDISFQILFTYLPKMAKASYFDLTY